MFLHVAEGPAATRAAWEEVVGSLTIYSRSFTVDYAIQAELDALPPVAGCADMRRVEGKDPVIPVLLVGMSLCAADPDVLVLAYVSGTVEPQALHHLSGHEASDRVVELVLASSETIR